MTADRDEYMRRQEADHALLDMRTRPTTAQPALWQPFGIPPVAERCPYQMSEDGGSCSRRVPCTGVLLADGFMQGGCGEPCSFVMDRTNQGIDLVAERAQAEKDSQLLGTGFLVDGQHVSPSRVTMIRKAYWPHVTTTELHDDLARVLRDKGASDEWVAFVMGELQLAATQYAHTRWLDGYHAARRGEPIPNPQGPPKTGTGTCRDGA